MLRAQALRLAPRLLERHQRIAAKVQALGRPLIAVAKLEGDLALGRDPLPVAAFFERRALLPVVGLKPCVRKRHTHPCMYIARERGVKGGFMYAAMYTNPPSLPVSP